MRLVTVLTLLLVLGLCAAPAMAGKDDPPIKPESGTPLLPLDYDYYQISLTSGVTVILETMAGPHCDPDVGDTQLYLYGPNSCTAQVGYNDDISYPSNNYSRITYTPTTSGVYYIKVQGYPYGTYEGCYKLQITCGGTPGSVLVDEVEPNDACGATVQTVTCDNYVHGRIGAVVASGACCTPCGACTVTSQAACVSPNIWHGEWLTCSPINPCPVGPVPPNDTCAGAILLACGQNIVVNGSLTCANNDYDPTSAGCTGFAAVGPDVAYMVNMAVGDVLTANISAYVTSFDSSLYLVTDCANVFGSCVVGQDVYPNPPGESITWTALTAGTYYLIVDKYGTAAADGFTLTYSLTCPPITGACCDFTTGNCTVTTEVACLFSWLGAGVPCDLEHCPLPPPLGACCDPSNGECHYVTEANCPIGFNWHGDWTCDPVNPCPVPPPTGACCDAATGACTITTELDCTFTWLGANVPCNDLTCPVPLPKGACCNPDTGECAYVEAAQCPSGWTWMVGVLCAPTNPCPPPPPIGACCDLLGGCTMTTEALCVLPSVWYGTMVCTPINPCPPPVPTKDTTWGQIKSNYR